MRARHLASLALAAILVVPFAALEAQADPWVFKHDQFPSDLAAAANAVDGGQFYTQPGFVAGEAFGQIYKPLPEMYPLLVTGFDVILAAPPYALSPLYSNVTIEIYNSSALGADPESAPIFSVTSGDLFNPQTQDLGFPFQGNVGIHVDFGQGDPEDRPPMITEGKLWLVVRFNDAAADLSSEWNTLACMQMSLPELGLEACGCQNTGTLHDNDITKKVNVLHHVTPLGQCSGNKAWSFMEDIPATSTGFTIDGDVILRLHADVAAGPCEPMCDGKQCGSDGCGGECGTCADGKTCDDGQCVSCVRNCLSKQCGDDGCGGVCGNCAEGSTCGGDFFCHLDCAPSCGGKECGPDGCGGTCGGGCEQGESCQAGQCVTSCTGSCLGKECGDDGCGVPCGACEDDETCTATQLCVPNDCEPACDGRQCGADGCGGSCGGCPDDGPCVDGACVTDAPAFAVLDVSPQQAFAQTPTTISITGTGFQAGATVKVGAADCTGVSVTGTGLISATVPALAVGTYSVIVINPGDDVATLANAFTVVPVDLVSVGKSDEGCAGGSGLPWLAAAAALALALRRSRRG
ncbi:MAG: IPT/TIG domain-containing protein [Deltaproteobacteria bacterium]|nr:IPT/TIG domain-containing protein [Deltaproteobacteria bacterium]